MNYENKKYSEQTRSKLALIKHPDKKISSIMNGNSIIYQNCQDINN